MIYSEQKDDVLVMLTLAGDQSAYEELVIRHQKNVLASAFAITNNNYLAEDAAQDAFVTAWMKLDMLRDPVKYGSWVCRIARNSAKNMMLRFKEYISFDRIEGMEYERDAEAEEYFTSFEESESLKSSLERLPDKVKRVIYLHYFEGMSLAEIAKEMMSPVGTVKWQLHEGRRILRKELRAMNENKNDTLVVKVMKKVEELKLWRLVDDKKGFEKAYEKVHKEIDALPESSEKQYALADTLLLGWWWLPGDKNDALMTRIKNAALSGHNDEVMEAIIGSEASKFSGDERIRFVLEEQIPFLKENNFTKSLGYAWFWLGYEYFRKGDTDAGFGAYNKVLEVLKPSDVYYANALSAIQVEKTKIDKASECDFENFKSYYLCAIGEEYRYIDGVLRFWGQPGYNYGDGKFSKDVSISYCAFLCDGYFYVPGVKPGYVKTTSKGYTLTFETDNAEVVTKCGHFTGCELWTVDTGKAVYKTYYKRGVGIVRQEEIYALYSTVKTLAEYKIAGGDGLVPCCGGNAWKYVFEGSWTEFESECDMAMTYADDKKAVISGYYYVKRYPCNDKSWQDVIQQFRARYVKYNEDGSEQICDVRPYITKAKELAGTPYQKMHTDVACNVMERILLTDEEFNPARKQSGHWNFFGVACVKNADHIDKQVKYYSERNDMYIYSFEWKSVPHDDSKHMFLYNDVFGILHDALGCLWSDDWAFDVHMSEERVLYSRRHTADFYLDRIGTVITPAGRFEDCVRLSLDIKGMSGGLAYRGGRKEYIFAPGIGVVRTVNYYKNSKNDECTSVFELTYYKGKGEGYMPLFAGMMRHYDAVGQDKEYTVYAEYTCETSDNGALVLFSDQCGIRNIKQNDA